MRANTVDKIYCIRFVKLPPSQIAVDRPFDIVLSIADDVGTPLPAVDKLCRMIHACNTKTSSLSSFSQITLLAIGRTLRRFGRIHDMRPIWKIGHYARRSSGRFSFIQGSSQVEELPKPARSLPSGCFCRRGQLRCGQSARSANEAFHGPSWLVLRRVPTVVRGDSHCTGCVHRPACGCKETYCRCKT